MTRRNSGAARAATICCAGLLALIVAACGLPQDKEPQKFALAPRSEQALKEVATTTTLGPTRTTPQLLYFVKVGGETDTSDALASVTVPVRESGPQDVPKAVLEQLFKGPTSDQRAQDLRSFVPADSQVESVTVDNGVATVNINNLGTIEGRNQRLAAAQIVFTLTEITPITGVRFVLNGKPASVPLGNTESSTPGEVVGRADYPQLNEMLSASTTTTPADPLPPNASAVPPSSDPLPPNASTTAPA